MKSTFNLDNMFLSNQKMEKIKLKDPFASENF